MSYEPRESRGIETVSNLLDYVMDELRKIAAEFSETTALDLREVHQEPVRPRDGMIVAADGTDWDPGDGRGVYVYLGGWTKVWSPGSTILSSDITWSNTNDNAAAGDIGEYISAELTEDDTPITLSDSDDVDVLSISLTAGDWDVWGTLAVNSNDVLDTIRGWINNVSATAPTRTNSGVFIRVPVGIDDSPYILPVGKRRYSFGGTATVFLGANVTFGGATSVTAFGFLGARRVR